MYNDLNIFISCRLTYRLLCCAITHMGIKYNNNNTQIFTKVTRPKKKSNTEENLAKERLRKRDEYAEIKKDPGK